MTKIFQEGINVYVCTQKWVLLITLLYISDFYKLTCEVLTENLSVQSQFILCVINLLSSCDLDTSGLNEIELDWNKYEIVQHTLQFSKYLRL